MKVLLVALVALLLAGDAFAADGFYKGTMDCTGTAETVGRLEAGQFASWCPVSTTTQVVSIRGVADCNWNADTSGSSAGSVTLTATKCSGSTTAANDCKNLLTDSTGNSTITSGDPTGFFSLDSGLWLITASGTAANGRLLCSGR